MVASRLTVLPNLQNHFGSVPRLSSSRVSTNNALTTWFSLFFFNFILGTMLHLMTSFNSVLLGGECRDSLQSRSPRGRVDCGFDPFPSYRMLRETRQLENGSLGKASTEYEEM